MIRRTVSLDCGTPQLMRAREALCGMRGVVAAEVVVGQNALRVYQGDELSEENLAQALTGCGITRACIRIH